jgi:hypothetical protein
VTVNPKHPPKSGATYTALTFGSLSGSFTSHTAGFTLTTSANNIQVTSNKLWQPRRRVREAAAALRMHRTTPADL